MPREKSVPFLYILYIDYVFWMVPTDFNLTLLRIYFTHVTWNAHPRIYSLIPRRFRWGKQHGWNMLASRSWNGSWKLSTTVGETWRVKLWGLTSKLSTRICAPKHLALAEKTPPPQKKTWLHHFPAFFFCLAQVSMSVALCFSRFQNFQTPWDLKKIFKLKA